MIAARVLPEKKVSFIFPWLMSTVAEICNDNDDQYGNRPWYRHVCAVGAVFNILMMITANTIGFVLGTEHTLTFLKLVFGTWKGEKASEL